MKMNSSEKVLYRFGIVILWGTFFTICFFTFLSLFFPSQRMTYDFNNRQILREIPNQGLIKRDLKENGTIGQSSSMAFDTETTRDYSRLNIRFHLDESSKKPKNIRLSVRRGYKATFERQGNPILFPSGSLLRSSDEYFFVDKNLSLIRFESLDVAKSLGWTENSFEFVREDELSLYRRSESDVLLNNGYPQGSLLRIDENYYVFTEKGLTGFLSENAFLSRYPRQFAAIASADILQKNTLTEDRLGFENASLLSFGPSIFIVDKEMIYPIADPMTFTSFGLSWNNVVPANSEEISFYRKGRQFTLIETHLEGTRFWDKKRNELFLYENKSLRPILGEALKNLSAAKGVVSVDFDASDETTSCSTTLKSSNIVCDIDISPLTGAFGNIYRTIIDTDQTFKASDLRITLNQDISWNNLRFLLTQLKQQVLNRL